MCKSLSDISGQSKSYSIFIFFREFPRATSYMELCTQKFVTISCKNVLFCVIGCNDGIGSYCDPGKLILMTFESNDFLHAVMTFFFSSLMTFVWVSLLER